MPVFLEHPPIYMLKGKDFKFNNLRCVTENYPNLATVQNQP